MTTLAGELKRAIQSVGGKKNFDEQAKQYRRDSEYLEQNREALLQQYPDRWVAVYRGEVQAVADDVKNLVRMIERKDVSPNEAVISFLSSKEAITLF